MKNLLKVLLLALFAVVVFIPNNKIASWAYWSLFLLMFFTGAAFPISGGKLFSVGGKDFMMNHILSPTWAIEALNKVLVSGLEIRETIPEMVAILVLTLVYGFFGTWAFKKRHMRAR